MGASPLSTIEFCTNVVDSCDDACRASVVTWYEERYLSGACSAELEFMGAAEVSGDMESMVQSIEAVYTICSSGPKPSEREAMDGTEARCLASFDSATLACGDADIFTTERCSSLHCIAAARHLLLIHDNCTSHTTWPLEVVEFELLGAVTCPCADDVDLQGYATVSHRDAAPLTCSLVAEDALCQVSWDGRAAILTGLGIWHSTPFRGIGYPLIHRHRSRRRRS